MAAQAVEATMVNATVNLESADVIVHNVFLVTGTFPTVKNANAMVMQAAVTTALVSVINAITIHKAITVILALMVTLVIRVYLPRILISVLHVLVQTGPDLVVNLHPPVIMPTHSLLAEEVSSVNVMKVIQETTVIHVHQVIMAIHLISMEAVSHVNAMVILTSVIPMHVMPSLVNVLNA